MGWMGTEDNLAIAWVIAHVHPDHRRRGIGTALVAATEASLDEARTELVSATQVPPEQVVDHPYRRFAESLGYAVTSVSSVRELGWPVERSLLDALVTGDPDGYRVESYIDGVPDDYRPSLGVLKGLVDVDAPSGDIAFEPSPVTPEHYAEELRRHSEAGRRLVESVALDGSGDVVAYSELVVPSLPGRFMSQMGTLVLDAHRGHRLGLAVKVASLRALLDLGVTNPVVRTGNDDTNTHMVAINEQLGFVPVQATLTVLKRR
jgi:GNAT superfamily N-acetyltransferase